LIGITFLFFQSKIGLRRPLPVIFILFYSDIGVRYTGLLIIITRHGRVCSTAVALDAAFFFSKAQLRIIILRRKKG
jgi:hypothetical protein